jgi:hypothetical protein
LLQLKVVCLAKAERLRNRRIGFISLWLGIDLID